LQAAIAAVFDKVNDALECRNKFEFSQERRFSVADCLARFDAIFTLNQDLLLERNIRQRSRPNTAVHAMRKRRKSGLNMIIFEL
jgi:hypothetical protein